MTAEVAQARPYELALKEIGHRAEIDTADSFTVAADVADKILTAESIEDILSAPENGPGGIETLTGKLFRFVGGSVRWANSAEKYREGGTGKYVFFEVLMHNGEQRGITTGASNVVFQVRALERKGVFDNAGEVYPYDFTVKSREVSSGTLYWLGAP